MDYEKWLVSALKNPDGYLWREDSSSHSYLNGLAEDAFNDNSEQGKIASLFIYHQLNQEILNLLIRYCEIVIRGSIYPLKFTEEFKLENLDFGIALQKLQKTIEFKNKSRILSKSAEINKLRNLFAHNLVKNHFQKESEDQLKEIKLRFEAIFKDWQESMEWFYDEIEKIKVKPEIYKVIQKHN